MTFVILSLCVAHYTQLNRTYEWLYYAGITSSLVVFLLSVVNYKYSLFALGVGICTLPFLGAGHLNLFVSCWLFGSVARASASERENKVALSPLFAVCSLSLLFPFFLGAIFTFFKLADPLILETILSEGGLHNFNVYLAKGHFAWHQALLIFFGYLAMMMTAWQLHSSKSYIDCLFKGLGVGSLLSCLVLLCQWLDVHRWLSFNRDAFWVFTKRYEGTFSDPNAFGLMAVFLVPLFLYEFYRKKSYLYLISAISLLVALPSSGSRSAFLGFAIFFIVFSLRGSKSKLKVLLFSTLIFIAFVFVISIPKVNNKLQEYSPGVSFTRVLKTLNRESAKESLSSRVIMGQIAIEMWKQSPFIGVGLNRFYGLQKHVADKNDIPLGTWRDNANNYYLQILSEQGIFGLSLVLFSFFILYKLIVSSRKESEENHYPLWLFAFAILLLTGPHLFFDELRYLLAVLIALSVGSRSLDSKLSIEEFVNKALPYFAPVALVSLVYLCFIPPSLEERSLKGFWGREGKVIWTGKKAVMKVCPNPMEPGKLFVKTMHPDLPVTFTLRYRGGKKMKLHAVSHEWLELPLVLALPGEIEFEVDKLFAPPNDRRWLGLQLIIPEDLCEL